MRRILQEEELAGLSEDSKRLDQGEGRMSERHLKAEIEKRKKALEELARETDWIFDCGGCGIHGENLVGVFPRLVDTRFLTRFDRMTARGLLLVKNATCGSIWPALDSAKRQRNKRTFNSSAASASDAKRTR